MDLLSELVELIQQLEEAKVPYALCGGFALSVYGVTRPTKDVDILLPAAALPLLRRTIMRVGYEHEGATDSRRGGQVLISRFFKIDEDQKTGLRLDVVHVTPLLQEVWDGRRTLSSEMGQVTVVTKEGLVELLRLRDSASDHAVIARLETWD